MKVAFAGTPAFAQTALAAIAEAGFDLPRVLTQPDRPAGRGMQLQPSPVKQWALAHGLKVLQPRSLRMDGRFADDAALAQRSLQEARIDLMVVAAYGLILPRWALDLPRLGCLNIHASLLPRWRGAAPIQRAIEAGDAETGITIMQMDAGLDTGAMRLDASEPIHEDDTSATLHDRLATLGAQLIVRALRALAAGEPLPARAQPEQGVTYAAKIDKSEAVIDWTRPAAELERRARAFDPFPGLNFAHAGETVKLWRARVVPGTGAPGTVLPSERGRCIVSCGEGALELVTLQRPGHRRCAAADFLRGHPLAPGTALSASA